MKSKYGPDEAPAAGADDAMARLEAYDRVARAALATRGLSGRAPALSLSPVASAALFASRPLATIAANLR